MKSSPPQEGMWALLPENSLTRVLPNELTRETGDKEIKGDRPREGEEGGWLAGGGRAQAPGWDSSSAPTWLHLACYL